LHLLRRLARGFGIAEHHHDLVPDGLDDLAVALRYDLSQLAEAGFDGFGGGLVAEQLVERGAAAHVGKQDRSFLGDEGHRYRLSLRRAHLDAWALRILVKYLLFS